MLNSLLFVLVLLFLAINLHIIYRKNLSITLAFCFLTVPLLFYLAGAVGDLRIGYYVLGVLLVSSSVYAIFRLVQKNNKFGIGKRTLRTLVLFSAIVVFAKLISSYHAKDLAVWDFYYFYARALKAMALNHEIYLSVGKELLGDCITYPPFYILYWYIPAGLTQHVNVSGISFLNSVFLYVFLLPFADECFERKTRASYWIVASLFLLPNIYQVCVPYTSLFLDAPMGMLFGFLLCACFFLPKDNFSRITMCLATAALVLFKPAGIFFAIVATIVILLNQRYETKPVLNGASNQKGRRSMRVSPNLIFAVILIASTLASYGSWKVLLQNAALNDTNIKLSTSNIFQLISAPSADQLSGIKALVLEFLQLFSLPYANQPSLVAVLLTLGVFWGILSILKKDVLQRRKQTLFAVILALSFLIYIVGLFYTSIFVFTYEQYTLASFQRYCSPFFIGVFFLLCVSILLALSESKVQDATKAVYKERNHIVALVMVVFMLLTTALPGSALYNESSPVGFFAYMHKHPMFFYNTKLTTPENTMDEEESIFLERTKGIPENSKVCVLTSQLDTSFYYIEFVQFPYICKGGVLLNYTKLDRIVHHAFNTDAPVALLDRIKREADYVYLVNVNDTIKEYYGCMFQNPDEITDHTLYQVATEGTSTLLVPVS